MKRRDAASRPWLLALVCVAVFAGCKDNGLRDRNLPLAEAQNRQFRYAVYESTEAPAIAVGGRHWMRANSVEDIADHVLVPVGTSAGTRIYARRGDEAPYSRLYAELSDGRWSPLMPLN